MCSSDLDQAEEEVTEPEVLENVASNALIEAFIDIPDNHWAREAISFVLGQGILVGISEEHFAPSQTMTRAMFATALYRLAGEPEQVGANRFLDVKAGTWYEKGVVWANNAGILHGISEDSFGPDKHVTREQIATMLDNLMEAMAIELPEVTEPISPDDQATISPWAVEGMQRMLQVGIIVGDDKNNCNPQAEATRAEVSEMLYRFVSRIK